MNITIASGKGGTGKTMIAVNLAWMLGYLGKTVRYLDCDVEEPNGHLFFKPQINKTEIIGIPVPSIDESKCNVCGKCVSTCQYNALVRLGTKIMVFPDLCHGCGGCTLVCPQKAIVEVDRNIGVIETGRAEKVEFVHGRLDVGAAMSPPLIRKVLKYIDASSVNIVDAPPGTSCPVITSMSCADMVVLVADPTPFGINDLNIMLDVIDVVRIQRVVIINRADYSAEKVYELCNKRNVHVIAQIPDDRRIAETYSAGHILCTALPYYGHYFTDIWKQIRFYIRNIYVFSYILYATLCNY